MVIDYRKININTMNDNFRILHITEILDKFGKNIYYTILNLGTDLKKFKYKKIQNVIQTRAIFNTCEFNNAPPTFQRKMNFKFCDYINKICIV